MMGDGAEETAEVEKARAAEAGVGESGVMEVILSESRRTPKEAAVAEDLREPKGVPAGEDEASPSSKLKGKSKVSW